jgi:pyruvate carboxylase
VAGRAEELPEVTLDPADDEALDGPQRRAVLSRLLFPGPWKDYEQAIAQHGDVSMIPTEAFFYGLSPGRPVSVHLEAGVEVLVELQTVGELSEGGMRTLHVRVNGQPRPVQVRDRSVQVQDTAARRADPGDPRHVGAALPGLVLPKVSAGDRVTKGQALAVVEAMKMESTVSSPADGTVVEVAVATGTNVEVGDLLVVLGD